jgi:hypothetical protein
LIYQNAEGIVPDAQRYSCRFNCILRAREVLLGQTVTVEDYNAAWVGSRDAGIISGDLNRDGDFDDIGEDEILDDQALFDYLRVPLRAVPILALGLSTIIDDNGILRVAPQLAPLDYRRYWVLERWVWHSGHFVHGRGYAKDAPIWDPIAGGSNTRRRGFLESLRVFEIVKV